MASRACIAAWMAFLPFTCALQVEKLFPRGRVAVVLKGESFRSKRKPPASVTRGEETQVGQHIRSTCGHDALETQEELVAKHLSLIDSLEGHGFGVDLFGMTYKCTNGKSYAATLPKLYESRFKEFRIISERDATQYTSIIESLEMARKSHSYDYYMLLRWDYYYNDLHSPCFLTLFDNGPPKDYAWVSTSNEDGLFVISKSYYNPFMKFVLESPPGVRSGCCSTRCPVACNRCIPNFLSWLGVVMPRFDGENSPVSKCFSSQPRSLVNSGIVNKHLPDYISYDKICMDCFKKHKKLGIGLDDCIYLPDVDEFVSTDEKILVQPSSR